MDHEGCLLVLMLVRTYIKTGNPHFFKTVASSEFQVRCQIKSKLLHFNCLRALQRLTAIMTTSSMRNALLLTGLLCFALKPLLGASVLVVVGLVLVASCFFRNASTSVPSLALVAALCLYSGLMSHWYIWPVYLLVPIAVATIAALYVQSLPALAQDLRLGQLGVVEVILILGLGVSAGLVLLVWFHYMQPDLSGLEAMIPKWSPLALVGVGVAFSVVNATLEEIVWRGIIQRRLMTFMTPALSVLGQGISFGAFHYTGFPSGVLGVSLATLYGLVMGAFALYSGGILAPIAAHIVADMVIFAIVASALYT